MTKYICHPKPVIYPDLSCQAAPCIIEVAPGSPSPSTCPYNGHDCNYACWKPYQEATNHIEMIEECETCRMVNDDVTCGECQKLGRCQIRR